MNVSLSSSTAQLLHLRGGGRAAFCGHVYCGSPRHHEHRNIGAASGHHGQQKRPRCCAAISMPRNTSSRRTLAHRITPRQRKQSRGRRQWCWLAHIVCSCCSDSRSEPVISRSHSSSIQPTHGNSCHPADTILLDLAETPADVGDRAQQIGRSANGWPCHGIARHARRGTAPAGPAGLAAAPGKCRRSVASGGCNLLRMRHLG